MARKKHEEEHENHERWLVSYADFITLLFAFFVVMYSVSRVDNKRLAQTAQAIKWALHYKGTGGLNQMPVFQGPPTDGGGIAGLGGANVRPQVKQQVEKLREKLDKKLRPYLIDAKSPKVQLEARGRELVVRMSASHFFDAGLAALRPESLPVLDAIVSELAELNEPIRVEGHSDSGVLRSPRFRDNWDLSSARAARVVSYIESAHHVNATLLSATGFGDSRPLLSNDTPTGREANRRIELVVEVAPGGAVASLP